MSEMTVPIVKRCPPHGELRADDTRYVIPSKEKDYAPWVIEAVPPTWRDVWSILRGRFVPKLRVYRPMSAAECSNVLKAAWVGPKVREQLNASSLLLG